MLVTSQPSCLISRIPFSQFVLRCTAQIEERKQLQEEIGSRIQQAEQQQQQVGGRCAREFLSGSLAIVDSLRSACTAAVHMYQHSTNVPSLDPHCFALHSPQIQPPPPPPQQDDSAQREAAERERQRGEQERLRQHREWERAQALAAAPAQVCLMLLVWVLTEG